MISQTPQGVAGSIVDWSRHMRPTLTTWKPSTSLVGATALQRVRSSMWSARKQKYSLWIHNQPNQSFWFTAASVYPGEAAAPGGHQHDDLCWAYRWGLITPPHWCLNAWGSFHCWFLWEVEKVRKQTTPGVWIRVLHAHFESKSFSLLTNISGSSCLIQDVRVTGRIVSYQDHTQVRSPVTS